VNQVGSRPLLWHYTTFDGLHGIITQGKLFASSLPYLNDTEEFLYTIKPLLELLDAQGVSLADLVRGLRFQSVPSMVKAVFQSVRGQRPFVTCFSEERDDLSQWRSYTPRPPGFAIGFQADELQPLANSFGFGMIDCRYPQPAQQAAEVKATFEGATKGMEEEKRELGFPAKPEALEEFINKWAFKIVEAMIDLAPKNKHPKFATEKEVRLIGHVGLATDVGIGRAAGIHFFEVEYRLSGSLVVPYVKIPARASEGPSPIKEILVGPCPHQQAVIEATRQMCVQHEVRPDVLPSDIPYRNW
jgi:hypothetical protein